MIWDFEISFPRFRALGLGFWDVCTVLKVFERDLACLCCDFNGEGASGKPRTDRVRRQACELVHVGEDR